MKNLEISYDPSCPQTVGVVCSTTSVATGNAYDLNLPMPTVRPKKEHQDRSRQILKECLQKCNAIGIVLSSDVELVAMVH